MKGGTENLLYYDNSPDLGFHFVLRLPVGAGGAPRP